jgi:hypothetical protein
MVLPDLLRRDHCKTNAIGDSPGIPGLPDAKTIHLAHLHIGHHLRRWNGDERDVFVWVISYTPVQQGMSLVGTVENCCTPHERVCVAGGPQTPAMAAGITEHGWTVRELLAFPVPPPRWTPPKHRGRPSHALKHLMARWCGDHG